MNKIWVSTFGLIILMFTAVAWTAPVPDTGQAKCYNATVEIPCPSSGQPFYGQDANYSINPMSYTKLDGSGNALPDSAASWVMVRDNVTGLIWEVKNSKDGNTDYSNPHDTDNIYTWYDSNPATNGGDAGTPGNGTDTEDFINALNSAHFGGNSDWRLPTFKELESIVNYNILIPGPTINVTYFPNTQSYTVAAPIYWTSNTVVGSNYYVWYVNFADDDYGGWKFVYHYALAVRGGQSQQAFVNNSNGTVTDTSGLMWQQETPDNTMSWEQALSYCDNSTLAGYTDWRLPTKKELESLVDYGRRTPAINTTFFPDTVSSSYWSSTTHPKYTYYAFCVDFYNGSSSNLYKNYYGSYYIRAVRGGQPGPLALPGDLNGDNVVDLKDAVIALQILSGISPQGTILPAADVNGDGKIGMAEAIYTLQKVAGF